MSFGGKYWPINAQDMNLGPISNGSDVCFGGIFVYGAGRDNSGGPTWVVGVAFLKNVYSVFRSQPTSIGFAELSASPGSSPGEFHGPAGFFYWEMYPSSTDGRGREWKQHQRWCRGR